VLLVEARNDTAALDIYPTRSSDKDHAPAWIVLR
jgi:hypothetical protein